MIGQLNQAHDRKRFDCGNADLNEYLQRFSKLHAKKGISRTYVMTLDSGRIAGFYTLSMGGLAHDTLPEALRGRFPRFPVPVARLGRLAVDIEYQQMGVGKRLLVHALETCLKVSDIVGMAAVVIDAKDDAAKKFYSQYEFENLPDQPLLLWLPLGALKRVLG